MRNLKSAKWIWLKGGLFLFLGIFSAGLLVLQLPDVRSGVLLVIAIWAFCRAYYFVFYVIEGYVDPDYRFAGILHFLRYAMGSQSPDRRKDN